MADIRYSYVPVPTIKDFSKSDLFVRGLMGPFGSGKSSGCVMEIVRRAAAQAKGPDGIRRSRWAVIRNTYPQLRDTTIRTFHQWLPPSHFGDWRATDHDYVINRLAPDLHIEVLFRALDRPQHVANLLSLDLTGAWINEAREIPWTIVQVLQGRVGRFPAQINGGPTWWGIVMDTNPPDDDSWWYRKFEEERPENWKLFRQPSGLAPDAENLAHLPPKYYENLIAGMDAAGAKVYVKGEYGYVQDGKPVYPEYSDEIHCNELADATQGLLVHRGWDFGLTPACTLSQITPTGRWVTFDELTSDSIGIDRFSDVVLAHCAATYSGYKFEDVGDPAGMARAQTDERSCFDILKGKGIDIEPGDQSPTMRQESVKWSLRQMVSGKPMLQIHPRCKMLRKGYQGRYKYRRLQTAEERYVDQPEKNDYSHPHDANQYVAAKLFGARLKAAGVDPNPPQRPPDPYARRHRHTTAWAA